MNSIKNANFISYSQQTYANIIVKNLFLHLKWHLPIMSVIFFLRKRKKRDEEEEEREGGEEGGIAAGGGGAVSNARRRTRMRRGGSENPLGVKIDGAAQPRHCNNFDFDFRANNNQPLCIESGQAATCVKSSEQ